MQIVVKLTNRCNLRCKYCSEGNVCSYADISSDVFNKLVDDLPMVLDFIGDKDVDFLWHGGEPLCYNKVTLCKMMDYTKDKLGTDYKVSFSAQSNGTLINNEWIDIIKKYDISMGISLDGYESIHDKYRIDVDGKPTFKKIIDNIKLLEKNGINVGTLMVLNSSDDVDVDKLFDFIVKNNLSCKIHPVFSAGRAEGIDNLDEIGDSYVEIMRQLTKKSLESGDNIEIEPISSLMQYILGIRNSLECSFAGVCGKSILCLYPNGDLGFCGRQGAASTLLYGNVMKNSLLELYKSANAERIRERDKYLSEHDCKDCSYFRLCHGGCAFEAVNAFSVVEHKYPGCETRKKLLNFVLGDGLALLKKALIRQRRLYQASIKNKECLLKELKNEKQ